MSDDSWSFPRRQPTRAIAATSGVRAGARGVQTWDDRAAGRVDRSRADRSTESGAKDTLWRPRMLPDRTSQRVDAAAGTTHSDNRVQIGTLSRNFRDRLACGRAPHWELPDPVPRTPVRAGCRRLVPERDRRDRRPHAGSGGAGARVSPGPAGEPCAARNRGHRAARPTLRRRLSC